jgi:ferritin
MLSKTVQDALNGQINAELYSSYLYYSMSAYFEDAGLSGFASWMRAQAIEEMIHANKFFGYINDRGGRVELAAIEAPPIEWDSAHQVVQDTYDHEVKVTGLINGLVDVAKAESDHNTYNFLQWFVEEQVEEEASADDILSKLKLIKDSPSGLFMLDRDLGQRPMPNPMITEE